jgi:hypothetical protein
MYVTKNHGAAIESVTPWLNAQILPHADSSGRFTCLGSGVDRVSSRDGQTAAILYLLVK